VRNEPVSGIVGAVPYEHAGRRRAERDSELPEAKEGCRRRGGRPGSRVYPGRGHHGARGRQVAWIASLGRV